MQHDIAEIVWVARPPPQAALYEERSVPCTRANAKNVFLVVRYGLDEKPGDEEDGTEDVPGGAKMRRRGVAYNVGGVKNRDGEGARPNPEHLKDPESKESEEVVAHRVKAGVCSSFENAEEEEGREAEAPEHEEYGGYDILEYGQLLAHDM